MKPVPLKDRDAERLVTIYLILERCLNFIRARPDCRYGLSFCTEDLSRNEGEVDTVSIRHRRKNTIIDLAKDGVYIQNTVTISRTCYIYERLGPEDIAESVRTYGVMHINLSSFSVTITDDKENAVYRLESSKEFKAAAANLRESVMRYSFGDSTCFCEKGEEKDVARN